jgi:hypothetical protein
VFFVFRQQRTQQRVSVTPPGVGPGQPPLSGAQESALAATLARTGPPANPKTLTQRTNPQYRWLGKLHSIRKAIDECIEESLDERSPDEQTLVTATRHAVDRLLKGVSGSEAALTLAAESTEAFAPAIAQAARAQLEQMTRPPMASGMPPTAGMVPPPGGPPGQGPPVPAQGGPMAAPGAGMQPPVPAA